MGNTCNDDTIPNHFPSAGIHIGSVTRKDRNDVCQEREEQTDGDGKLFTLAQCTSILIATHGWCTSTIAASRQRVLHEVGEDGLDTVVGCTFRELDYTQGIRHEGDAVWNFAEGESFLRSRIRVQVRVIQNTVVAMVTVLDVLDIDTESFDSSGVLSSCTIGNSE